MPDPDLEMGGGGSSRPFDKGGGAVSKKTIISALQASVWSKNRRGAQASLAPPLNPPLAGPVVYIAPH